MQSGSKIGCEISPIPDLPIVTRIECHRIRISTLGENRLQVKRRSLLNPVHDSAVLLVSFMAGFIDDQYKLHSSVLIPSNRPILYLCIIQYAMHNLLLLVIYKSVVFD